MTWASVGSRVAGTFTTLAATADSVAYAGGAQGVLARTADSGQSWSNVSPPTEATVVSLAGFGPNRLYVLASDGSLQRSDNGGVSYSLLNPGTARPVAIAAIDADRLLLLGSGISISRNGGDTFDRVSGPAASSQFGAADLAAGAVFAYGNRSVFVSIDRGGSWQRVKTPKGRSIADLDFVSEKVGYLLDTRGALWKTTKRGRSWRPVPGVGAAGSAVEFSSGRTGYVVVRGFGSLREAGIVMRTTDGGQSWHPQLVSRFFIGSLESTARSTTRWPTAARCMRRAWAATSALRPSSLSPPSRGAQGAGDKWSSADASGRQTAARRSWFRGSSEGAGHTGSRLLRRTGPPHSLAG